VTDSVAEDMEGYDETLMSGEPLIQTCLAKPDDQGVEINNASSLNIQFCTTPCNSRFESLPMDRVRRLNASVIQLTIVNVTTFDAGDYRCCIGPDVCSGRKRIEIKGKYWDFNISIRLNGQ
jgi:hypothetical protein